MQAISFGLPDSTNEVGTLISGTSLTQTDTQISTIIVGQQLEIDTALQPLSQKSTHTPEKDATTSSPPTPPSNDRTTRTDGAYVLSPPTTATESARLDVQHDLWAISLGGRLHITPLDPKKAYKVN